MLEEEDSFVMNNHETPKRRDKYKTQLEKISEGVGVTAM